MSVTLAETYGQLLGHAASAADREDYELATVLTESATKLAAALARTETTRVPVLHVPIRQDIPRDAGSHAPNTCGSYTLHEVGTYGDGHATMPGLPCNSPIGWAAGTGYSGIQRQPAGWYHLDPEITDHEAVPAS